MNFTPLRSALNISFQSARSPTIQGTFEAFSFCGCQLALLFQGLPHDPYESL